MKCRGRLLKLIVLIAGMAATLTFSDAQETAKMETVLLPSSSPLVSFRILFQVGSASDPQGKEGVAALTAAMISGGGTRKLSYSEIVQAMYPMAKTLPNGDMLDASKQNFTLTFAKGNLPPVNAFWSGSDV